jgi:hypothetical protein
MKMPGKENYARGGALNPLDDTNRSVRTISADDMKEQENERFKYSLEGETGIPLK